MKIEVLKKYSYNGIEFDSKEEAKLAKAEIKKVQPRVRLQEIVEGGVESMVENSKEVIKLLREINRE